jgi:hypothetical protein
MPRKPKRPTRKQLEKWSKSQDQIRRERKAQLSAPITMEEVQTFMGRLVAISFCPDSECWIYVGKRNALTLSGMVFKTTAYPTVKHNGEVLGAHQFAYAASEGILPSEIDGDVHHLARVCIGYRCCNPNHLELLEHVEHARKGEKEKAEFGSRVAQRQSEMVQTIILDTPPRDKRPVEFKPVTGAGSLQRYFGGLPFLIRRGEIGGVDAESPQLA